MRLLNVTNAFKILLALLGLLTFIVILRALCTMTPPSLFIRSTEYRSLAPILNATGSVDNTSDILLKSHTKVILYFNPFWEQKDYYIGTGYRPFKNCRYTNCYATYDKQLLPLEKFDALIIHGLRNKNEIDQPRLRRPHQMYIYMNIEAPPFILSPDLKMYASFFNWTMTYRYDSDLLRRYGVVVKKKTNYKPPSSIRNKTKLAAWFVSNCYTTSKREVLVREIQKHISVDVYGSCGNLSCKRNSKLSADECYDMLEKNYKFYFSFENSFCKDYATEKVYYILKRNLIPVVYGGGNYNVMVPPKSVINVADFENVTQLVDYLRFLDRNEREYLKYFEWKKNYLIDYAHTACSLCEKLQDPVGESVYQDIHTWWWGPEGSYCKLGKTLPRIVRSLL